MHINGHRLGWYLIDAGIFFYTSWLATKLIFWYLRKSGRL